MNASQVNLRYIIEISTNPELIEFQSSKMVENTTYTFELMAELPQDIDVEITIIPSLLEMEVNGSAVLIYVYDGRWKAV